MTTTTTSSADLLVSATRGFDHLFSNDLAHAKLHFAANDDPFHLLGQGVCAFMEAALGMETALMAEASRCLALSEAGARRHVKSASPSPNSRFPPGLEWEILNADAVVLLGLTNALSESYMGYLQCMYSLNSAHSKFSKLFKTVFPAGLDAYTTPSISRASSVHSLSLSTPAPTSVPTKSLFARLTGSVSAAASTLSIPGTNVHVHVHNALDAHEDGPVEDLIVAGTAFGFGLFNLVFSLLPKKIQSVVGFLGFKHDRKLALRALAVAAGKQDVHSVFAGLVLMTYHGVVLLLSGYQADEAHTLQQYKAIVDSIEARYPEGALWILNRAKILRMSYDPDGAIRVLREGLRPGRPHSFAQADTLLVFELAWTLLGQRRYQEAADMFVKITELNSWSHGTYYFLAAGCYISLGETSKAQALLDAVPALIEGKKMGGKDLPTEVFIKKKLAFYQEKQKRRGGRMEMWVEVVKISVAEELGVFWNTHARIGRRIALAHIREWSALTPVLPPSPALPAPAPTPTPFSATTTAFTTTTTTTTTSTSSSAPTSTNPLDLDTPDELAVRHLLLGICERTAATNTEAYISARTHLQAACAFQSQVRVSTWIGGVAMFELAVLDLLEAQFQVSLFNHQAGERGGLGEAVRGLKVWDGATRAAGKKLDAALALAGSSVDLSSRLDSRVGMLRDEIAGKREGLGLGV
ncbi:hypothetical protein D9615_008805 [Tricholomella constricta]|uniref:Mitochondrial outer membrane protein IML2 n=1 Tax=Tricholomella constricta TaxID=117010 RepID=A0A8H5H7E3_9AGAR|nr:hypothetical protein D9615_008805 [Tricholomella constricta]